jgi:cyclic dehypoxanthinyl futalosine synthase
MGITRKEALDCFHSDDLIGLGMEADAIRRHLHPEGVVSYSIDGSIDYTKAANGSGYDPVFAEIETILAKGGTTATLQGKISPTLTTDWFIALFRAIKQRFPTLWLHSLSAGEILTLAHQSGSTIPKTLAQLQEAGLDSIPGNDAGILDDSVQQNNETPTTAEGWLAVHRAAHAVGIQTTAAMVFGSGETIDHRLNHLEALRSLQEETGGFCSFAPWSFTPRTASMPGFEEPTAVEYLKTLAISRLYLDNIENVQSNLETQGLKVLQVGLRFGGNDAGSVLQAKGPNAATEEQVRQVIRDAGFRPVQRDTLYRTMFLN